jgi:hypothetical protein
MSNISSFPTAVPDGDDLILGSQIDAAGTPHTKNFTVQSIVDRTPAISLGYDSYVALISQTGTNAPIPTVLHNSLRAAVTWSRQSSGNYTLTAASSIFTQNKTVLFINAGHGEQAFLPIYWERTSDTTITLNTTSDAELQEGAFELRIYE